MPGRLKIGSTTIFDAAESGSSSNPAGVRLQGIPGVGMMPVVSMKADGVGGASFTWPLMELVLEAANEGALVTLHNSVMTALDAVANATVIYEEPSGTAWVTMTAAEWPRARVERTWKTTGVTETITFQIIAENPDVVIPGGVGGQSGDLEWQYQQATGGLAGLMARGVFVTVGATTALAAAQAWVAGLDGSSKPAWMPSTMRRVDVVYMPTSVPGSTSLFTPVRVEATYREIPSAVASSWPSLVQDAIVGVSVAESMLDAAAGVEPMTAIVVQGTVTLKTEGNTTFISTDTKVAPGAVYALAQSAIDLLLTWFESIYTSEFSSLASQRIGKTIIEVQMDSGTCAFRQEYRAGSVIEWVETVECQKQRLIARSRDAEGKGWEYEPEGGPAVRIVQDLRIRSMGSAVLPRRVSLSKDWSEDDTRRMADVNMVRRGSDPKSNEWETRAHREWTYVSPGKSNTFTSNTVAMGPLPISSVGKVDF